MVSRLIGRRFDEVMASADKAVFLVTTVGGDGQRAGCLVGFATQCSIDPPRFLAGLSVLNHTHRVAADASLLAVHLVPRAARPLAALFAEETGDELDKFARCAWTPGPGDVPLLDDCPQWFVGRIVERIGVLGDHTGYLLEPVEAASPPDPPPVLTYGDVQGMDAGHPEGN